MGSTHQIPLRHSLCERGGSRTRRINQSPLDALQPTKSPAPTCLTLNMQGWVRAGHPAWVSSVTVLPDIHSDKFSARLEPKRTYAAVTSADSVPLGIQGDLALMKVRVNTEFRQ